MWIDVSMQDLAPVFLILPDYPEVSAKPSASVISAGKRISSATDGELQAVHGVWVPAIPAGMTASIK